MSIMSVFGLCRPFMFDMYALLVIFDGIKMLCSCATHSRNHAKYTVLHYYLNRDLDF